MLEVEMKFPTPPGGEAELRERLTQAGVVWGETVVQKDVYFAHPCRDFARTDEAVRLRRDGDANRITYKGPKLDTVSKTRREIELPLSDGPNSLADFQTLLEALGFRVVREVSKHRTHGQLAVDGSPVEVCWDEVAGLGLFLELEQVVPPEEHAAAVARLQSLRKAWGLGEMERRSYLEMLLTAEAK